MPVKSGPPNKIAKNLRWLAAFLFIVIASKVLVQFSSCSNKGSDDHRDSASTGSRPPVNINIPVFNADSAFYYVKKQVDFGPRVPNTPAHQACANFLASTMKGFADSVYQQQALVKAYDGKMLNMTNIIGEFNPAATKRIVLMSHWDTRHVADQDSVKKDKPIDGANDGGSGVGILLEIARIMSTNNPSIGVDIVLFDAEDYGQPENSGFTQQQNTYCLGSQYWAKNLHRSNYHPQYGILLDMVGAKDAKFAREQISVEYAIEVVDRVWLTAREAGYYSYFIYYDTKGPLVDDHLYVNTLANIPSIDIIEYDPKSPSGTFSKTWHTHNDKLENIDKNTLKAVGQTLLHLIYKAEAI